MKYVGAMFLSILFSLTLFEYATAHVQLDSPKGGETFAVGDTITIKWTLIQQHQQDNWDIYYSPDGGNTFDTLAIDLPNSNFEYQWVITQEITQEGRIRIVMDNTVETDYEGTSNNFSITETVVSVQDIEEIPKSFNLSNNYPNPFNPMTTIEYSLPIRSDVSLIIYNIRGREVARPLFGTMPAGNHKVTWDGSNQVSGVYIYELMAGTVRIRNKMILLK